LLTAYKKFISSMDESKVKEWSPVQRVKRPTGGGAVLHQTSDLSVSLLWPRHHNIFPEKPRDCYEEIHRRLLTAYKKFISSPAELELFVRCDAPTRPAADLPLNGGGISVCFEQPVCNDVMRGGKKIIGGALRLTREAILYQGNILLEGTVNLAALKAAIASAFGIAASPSADKSH
jgi:lipoate-protein ligase A